jgi:ABC-type branched-subunit amino acid transport system ATPase component
VASGAAARDGGAVAAAPAAGAPLLAVERVSRSFAGLAALRAVSFTVERGAICGLIGPNGAGKTTLLSIIAGSLRPSSGTVVFAGRDLTGAGPSATVRRGIVRTHQVPRPFAALSVLDNVAVGSRFGAAAGRGRRGRRAAPAGDLEILERVGLAPRAGAPAGTLSVGDQKRLELARALATRPGLLLCDEVCNGLTAAETAAILDLLRAVRAAGTTILFVEHNLRAVLALCDQVIVMNQGQVLAAGPPAAVQHDPAVIDAYLGRPSLPGTPDIAPGPAGARDGTGVPAGAAGG